MNVFATTGLGSVLRLLSLLFVFAVVLCITWIGTRWIGKFQKQRYTKGNIQIIEARQIGTNKFIYVAKIGNDYFALSSGKENFSVIGKLDPEGLELPDDNVNNEKDCFSNILDKVMSKKNRKSKEQCDEAEDTKN